MKLIIKKLFVCGAMNFLSFDPKLLLLFSPPCIEISKVETVSPNVFFRFNVCGFAYFLNGSMQCVVALSATFRHVAGDEFLFSV